VVVDAGALVTAARSCALRELHDMLVVTTGDRPTAPHDLLADVARALPAEDDAPRLPPRARVVMRLLRAQAFDAAWLVLQDNAVGVVEEAQRTSTSSGAPLTAWRLPLITKVEPPLVFAWLPGFRDPRFAAPDDAYDITDTVTAAVELEELWWDRGRLVLAGSAYLRQLPTDAGDGVDLVLRHGGDAGDVVVPGQRLHRPDLVKGVQDELTRQAWIGWSARIEVRSLRPAGLWKPTLRLTQQGLTREIRLGPSRAATVPAATRARAGLRSGLTRVTDAGWLDLVVVDPAVVRAPRRLLHVIATRAGGR
jgi:hypothetical protein